MRVLTLKYLLLAIAVCLLAVHLTLNWQFTGDLNQLSLAAFGSLSLLSLLWENHHNLTLKAGLGSSLLGGLLIGWIALRSVSVSAADDILREVSLLISGIGLALLASGVRGLKQHKKPLFILAIISLPVTALPGLIDPILGVSINTAKAATFALWYFGFEPIRQGTEIFWQTGGVEVNDSCSGIHVMILLCQLAGILALRYSFSQMSMLWILVSAIAITFVMNVGRVILLLFLRANLQEAAFEYWHHGGGAQWFSTIVMLAFGLACYAIAKQQELNQTLFDDVDPQS
ncbi:MAG: cyanoexosortase A [Roseofilum sp. SBFL]|uniref:cyanoexosortase A n=1 Tax=unclassified Roseofilum TaxID=2620099 RepID=UPI001B2EE036|nr:MULTISPECIES: cyanoexosortase A [unclassified Roseofilum]MBP0011603.1 cyanoexosortase A [Roseofilum sp. SID3]MBP0026661.1 cyanoexosortase A [Roseofilum sp. SID2]MBP0040092.1 cyanoexosortase A [Roseofilum sp. SID1]MBP0044031.1 cyanoexosortase A [Roseofilum sp. SBFL]